jgi:hypothetical protein
MDKYDIQSNEDLHHHKQVVETVNGDVDEDVKTTMKGNDVDGDDDVDDDAEEYWDYALQNVVAACMPTIIDLTLLKGRFIVSLRIVGTRRLGI